MRRIVIALALLSACSEKTADDAPGQKMDCEPTRLKMIAEEQAKLRPAPSSSGKPDPFTYAEQYNPKNQKKDNARLAALEGKPIPRAQVDRDEAVCRFILEKMIEEKTQP